MPSLLQPLSSQQYDPSKFALLRPLQLAPPRTASVLLLFVGKQLTPDLLPTCVVTSPPCDEGLTRSHQAHLVMTHRELSPGGLVMTQC